MPLSRPVLERQLKSAERTLAQRVASLQESGCAAEQHALDPAWRHASAACTAIRRRLVSIAKTEAIDAEVARRKTEKESSDAE